MKTNVILQGDALARLKELPNDCIDCVITSPPYWALRDYSRCDCVKMRYGNAKEYQEHADARQKNEQIIDPNCPKCKGTGYNEFLKVNQLGLEPTFNEYLDKLLAIFDEVKRVLKPTGTCWVNLGTTYASEDMFVVEKEYHG